MNWVINYHLNHNTRIQQENIRFTATNDKTFDKIRRE